MLTGHPSSTEIEVSLFGPGTGESIVVHLGHGDYVVVDSCRDERTGDVLPLKYLRQVAEHSVVSVHAIVATHAHDDHIAGLSEIVDAFEDASVWVPAAASREEFFSLLEVDAEEIGARPRTYSEYNKTYEALSERSASKGLGNLLQHAIENRPVFSRASSAGFPAVSVLALSPSDDAVTRSRLDFKNWFPESGSQPRRLTKQDPNTFACALLIEIGDEVVILGSDLLEGTMPDCGWARVVGAFNGRFPRAGVLKVPHHGAPNAHHAPFWENMIAAEVISILAPYRRGKTPRPSDDDQRRLCGLSAQVVSSASPALPAKSAQVKKTASMLKGLAKNVRDPDGRAGHVRLRKDMQSKEEWRVETDDVARVLCHS